TRKRVIQKIVDNVDRSQLLYIPHFFSDHFYLFIFDPHNKTLELYDSLLDYDKQAVDKQATALCWFLSTFLNQGTVKYQRVLRRKHQWNGYDCGVFVCLYAFLRSKGWTGISISKAVVQKHAAQLRQLMWSL